MSLADFCSQIPRLFLLLLLTAWAVAVHSFGTGSGLSIQTVVIWCCLSFLDWPVGRRFDFGLGGGIRMLLCFRGGFI